MERANWQLFTAMSSMQARDEHLEIDTMVDMFNDTVRRAADVAIPVTTGGSGRSTIAWWNADCTVTRREKKRALRRYQRTKSLADCIQLKRARAVARRVQRQATK